jgi:alpha-glucosidase
VRTPAGADWIDPWTGARHAGGTDISLPAPLDGLPAILARAGSAIPVDLACGGHRPEPFQRGLWLFPQEGEFSWSVHEDEGEGKGPPTLWRGMVRNDGTNIVVTVDREGPSQFGDDSITILLPPGETRSLSVDGRAHEDVTLDGRRGIRVTLD